MDWNFKREENSFADIPVGEHRVRIADAEKALSKKGNDMIILTLDVSGYKSRLWYYIVFLPENPQITNSNLTSVFDSFGISDGDFNLASWKGRVGACVTKQDDYGTKVRYFLSKKRAENLPPWQEPDATPKGKTTLEAFKDDADIPF